MSKKSPTDKSDTSVVADETRHVEPPSSKPRESSTISNRFVNTGKQVPTPTGYVYVYALEIESTYYRDGRQRHLVFRLTEPDRDGVQSRDDQVGGEYDHLGWALRAGRTSPEEALAWFEEEKDKIYELTAINSAPRHLRKEYEKELRRVAAQE